MVEATSSKLKSTWRGKQNTDCLKSVKIIFSTLGPGAHLAYNLWAT